MASQLFWSFLVLGLVTEASSWSCIMSNCVVSSWSPWSTCSQPCGYGGISNRTRVVTRQSSCGGSPCPEIRETRPCNQEKCANGGTPYNGGCYCRQEFSGQCCSQTEGKHNRSFLRPVFPSFVRLFTRSSLVRSFARSFVHKNILSTLLPRKG